MNSTAQSGIQDAHASARFRTLFGVFVLALLARLMVCWWAADRVPPSADGAFYHVVAQRIAAGHGYTWLWPDGAITYAAHYPVGYPAMVGLSYRVLGARPVWAMLENALLGALGTAAACHLAWLLMGRISSRSLTSRALKGGWLFASLLLVLSPTLLLYTPALMTESCVGALLTLATVLVHYARESTGNRPRWLLVATSALLAWACLLRPQAVLLAPVLGLLSARSPRRCVVRAVLLTTLTVGWVMPWTLRNCERLDRCVFVSANGGWNLLIGTFAEGRGGWVAVDGERVPSECREVFSEAGKDACFAEAGRRRIQAAPIPWLLFIPDKLRMTFDYAAAGTEHLAAAGAISDELKPKLQSIEYLWQRLFLLLGLLGAWRGAAAPGSVAARKLRSIVAVLGACTLVTSWSWLGWCAVAILSGLDSTLRRHVGSGACLGALVSTLLVHSVFFGAGRYSIPLWYAIAPVVGVGVVLIIEVGARLRTSAAQAEPHGIRIVAKR